jgi:hypothetical protein
MAVYIDPHQVDRMRKRFDELVDVEKMSLRQAAYVIRAELARERLQTTSGNNGVR